MRVITPLDLRRSLGAILDAASAGERFLVERDRRPVAMLISIEDGRRLDEEPEVRRRRALAALDRLETAGRERAGERAGERADVQAVERTRGATTEAVTAVRADRDRDGA
jgi:antitoxin (DNA-binding transcriptional repressor) of toxin-antitoxin stability system